MLAEHKGNTKYFQVQPPRSRMGWMEELNNIIIVFVITVHRSYLISAKDRLLDSWNDNDENVGDMIYMSGCRQEEEEEEEGDEK